MICPACHGSGRRLRADPHDGLWRPWRLRAEWIPCADCGGSGRIHCCEGERATPGDERRAAAELFRRAGENSSLLPGARAGLQRLGIDAAIAERAPAAGDIVVCTRLVGAKILPDNRIGACAHCGAAIQFRPVVAAMPATRLCLFCALDRTKGGDA